jgi:hypothetical protein
VPEQNLPLATAQLAARLVAAERDCVRDWLRALAALPGNPFGAAWADFGATTALACSEISAEVFNRVFGLTAADANHLPAILAWYRERRLTPVFDVNPYAIAPPWERDDIPLALTAHGYYQGTFHQLLYGLPAADSPALAAGVTVEEVGPGDAQTFGEVYEQVWGSGDQIRPLLGNPSFRCYLVFVDNQPAGLGVLHIANGIGSLANGLTAPPFRGRGSQSALLQRRIRDAALADCELIVSQCVPGSISQRNQLRAGLAIACTKAWWMARPTG